MADSKKSNPHQHTYMMLSRLQGDNDYFLGAGGRSERSLWAGNVDAQISEMKKLWNSLPKNGKPEWLSMEDIVEYENKMKDGTTYALGGIVASLIVGLAAGSWLRGYIQRKGLPKYIKQHNPSYPKDTAKKTYYAWDEEKNKWVKLTVDEAEKLQIIDTNNSTTYTYMENSTAKDFDLKGQKNIRISPKDTYYKLRVFEQGGSTYKGGGEIRYSVYVKPNSDSKRELFQNEESVSAFSKQEAEKLKKDLKSSNKYHTVTVDLNEDFIRENMDTYKGSGKTEAKDQKFYDRVDEIISNDNLTEATAIKEAYEELGYYPKYARDSYSKGGGVKGGLAKSNWFTGELSFLNW